MDGRSLVTVERQIGWSGAELNEWFLVLVCVIQSLVGSTLEEAQGSPVIGLAGDQCMPLEPLDTASG